MSFWSFDPRQNLRDTIGTTKDYNTDGTDEYVITVTDDYSQSIDVPLLMPSETRSGGEPYPMPFVEMVLVTSPARVHNVQGDVKEQEAYIDLNIWYTNKDTITGSSFGKTIADKLCDLVMTYRYSTPSVNWMEISNDGRELIEDTGKMVVFHRVIEIYCKYFG